MHAYMMEYEMEKEISAGEELWKELSSSLWEAPD